jgi:thioredoxin-like negative regulator of GroEL
MKKHRNTANRKAKRNKSAPGMDPDQKRRDFLKLIRNGTIGLAAVGGIGFFSVRAVNATMSEQNLNRLGKGRPTIVQIHDPQCPLCTALQRVTRKALRDFEDSDMQFLVADVSTEKGIAFAARYGAPIVTLLFFDKTGKLVKTLNGPQKRDFLTQAFADHLEAHG